MSKIFDSFSAKIVEKVVNESFSNEKNIYIKIQLLSDNFQGVFDLVLNYSPDNKNCIEVSLLESSTNSFLSRVPVIQSLLTTTVLQSKKTGKNKIVLSFAGFNHSISFVTEESLENVEIEDMLLLTIFNRLLETELSKYPYKDKDNNDYLNNKVIIDKFEMLKFFIVKQMEFTEMENCPKLYCNDLLIDKEGKQLVNEEFFQLFYLDTVEFIVSKDLKGECNFIYINFEQIEKDKYEYDSLIEEDVKKNILLSIIELVHELEIKDMNEDLLYFLSFYYE